MNIHGKDIHFALTIGASVEIAKMCPDGDIRRVGELLDGENYIKTVEVSAKMMKVMNEGYVGIERINGREADELTEDEILLLTPQELGEVTKVLIASFLNDSKGEIEAESKNVEKGAEA